MSVPIDPGFCSTGLVSVPVRVGTRGSGVPSAQIFAVRVVVPVPVASNLVWTISPGVYVMPGTAAVVEDGFAATDLSNEIGGDIPIGLEPHLKPVVVVVVDTPVHQRDVGTAAGGYPVE